MDMLEFYLGLKTFLEASIPNGGGDTNMKYHAGTLERSPRVFNVHEQDAAGSDAFLLPWLTINAHFPKLDAKEAEICLLDAGLDEYPDDPTTPGVVDPQFEIAFDRYRPIEAQLFLSKAIASIGHLR